MTEVWEPRTESCMARVGDRSAGLDHREEKQWSCHSAIPSVTESP